MLILFPLAFCLSRACFDRSLDRYTKTLIFVVAAQIIKFWVFFLSFQNIRMYLFQGMKLHLLLPFSQVCLPSNLPHLPLHICVYFWGQTNTSLAHCVMSPMSPLEEEQTLLNQGNSNLSLKMEDPRDLLNRGRSNFFLMEGHQGLLVG